ncbi:hypothetical protein BDB01DRAFT_841177 [Pilobolus umbonatus]|nr:hypothetical protein BDB01DRAFT_841177 [Pilobolus umbonatus]
MSNWSIDYSSLNKSNTQKIPNPIGFEPLALQRQSKPEKSARQLDSSDKDDMQAAIKMKRAWDVAMGPAKSIPMNAMMIYMSGTSLQIFTVMITAMLFFQPFKAIMSVQQTFNRFESKNNSSDLLLPKLTFVGLHIITILLGVYKVNAMGLLPNTTSDWLSFIQPKVVMEYSA